MGNIFAVRLLFVQPFFHKAIDVSNLTCTNAKFKILHALHKVFCTMLLSHNQSILFTSIPLYFYNSKISKITEIILPIPLVTLYAPNRKDSSPYLSIALRLA